MKKLRLIVVDDQRRVRQSIINTLRIHYPDAEVVAEAGDAESATEAIRLFRPDLVLLDIKMPGESGFEMLQKLAPYDFKVIFITAFDKYAIQAFKFSAVDYLLKPVVPKELVESLDRVTQQLTRENSDLKLNTLLNNVHSLTRDTKRLVLSTQGKMYVISLPEIIRCEASGNYTTFYLTDKKSIMVTYPIREYEEILVTYGFFRSHNSHLVNLQQVERVEKKDNVMIMRDGSRAMISERRMTELISALEQL
jgi:two-component system LytT family response regulator